MSERNGSTSVGTGTAEIPVVRPPDTSAPQAEPRRPGSGRRAGSPAPEGRPGAGHAAHRAGDGAPAAPDAAPRAAHRHGALGARSPAASWAWCSASSPCSCWPERGELRGPARAGVRRPRPGHARHRRHPARRRGADDAAAGARRRRPPGLGRGDRRPAQRPDPGPAAAAGERRSCCSWRPTSAADRSAERLDARWTASPRPATAMTRRSSVCGARRTTRGPSRPPTKKPDRQRQRGRPGHDGEDDVADGGDRVGDARGRRSSARCRGAGPRRWPSRNIASISTPGGGTEVAAVDARRRRCPAAATRSVGRRVCRAPSAASSRGGRCTRIATEAPAIRNGHHPLEGPGGVSSSSAAPTAPPRTAATPAAAAGGPGLSARAGRR